MAQINLSTQKKIMDLEKTCGCQGGGGGSGIDWKLGFIFTTSKHGWVAYNLSIVLLSEMARICILKWDGWGAWG